MFVGYLLFLCGLLYLFVYGSGQLLVLVAFGWLCRWCLAFSWLAIGLRLLSGFAACYLITWLLFSLLGSLRLVLSANLLALALVLYVWSLFVL